MKTTELTSKLTCRIVRGTDSVSFFSEDWDSLFRRAYKSPAFLSRAWVQTFISEKRVRGKPLFITVWSNSKLVALLPLVVCSYFGIKVAKVAPTSVLCYTGVLLDPDYPDAICVLVEAFAREKVAHVFYNKYTLSRDEFTNRLLEEFKNHGFLWRRWKRHICLKSELEPDFDQVLRKNRNKRQREKLLYHERRIFRTGDVKVTRYIGKQITPDIVARIADIQSNSWVKEAGRAVLAQPFYQRLILELGQAEIASIWLMANQDEDIAFLCALGHEDTLYPKWMSYRSEYGKSSLSYGKTMFMQVMRDACAEGMNLMDFGFGEDKWKEHWGTDQDNVNLDMTGLGYMGQVARFLVSMLLKCARYRWKLHRRVKNHRLARKCSK